MTGRPERDPDSLSERWWDRFSAEWWDLTSTRGMVGGLLGSALNLVGFALVVALVLLLDLAPPAPWPTPSPAAFWAATLAGGVAGAGFVALALSDRVIRVWRSIPARAGTNLLEYGLFAALVAVAPVRGMAAGVAFVLGRALAHLWIFVGARR